MMEMTTAELKELEGLDFLRACWGDEVADKLAVTTAEETLQGGCNMDAFLTHCTACGGNWGGMLLTGIKELFPKTWDAIPNDMGVFAWACLCEILNLCGVVSE